jgi:cyclase
MKVSQHVHCRIGEDGESNNGFIVCDDCCIVVDTANYPDQTQKDLEIMRTVTDSPVKFLINTHFHGDHTFGNMFFSDIIAHTDCYRKLKEVTPLYLKHIEDNMEENHRFEGFTITLPTLLFAGELSLMTVPEIVITHYGGHTAGSAAVYIPEEKVLFSGDLLFEGSHPYLADADIQQWIASLKSLLQLDIATIIPGHGQVCDKREIKAHIEYLETFYNNLRELKESYTKEEIFKNLDRLNLPEMEKEYRIQRNVEAQYHKI